MNTLVFKSPARRARGGQHFSSEQARQIGKKLGVDWSKTSFSEFLMGINEEIEHRKLLKGDPLKIAQVALDHLKEDARYYTKLERAMEKSQQNHK